MKTQRLQLQKRDIKPALSIKNLVKVLLLKEVCRPDFTHLRFPLKAAEVVPVVVVAEVEVEVVGR